MATTSSNRKISSDPTADQRPHKSVEFDLPAGKDFVLQFSGSTEPTVLVAITLVNTPAVGGRRLPRSAHGSVPVLISFVRPLLRYIDVDGLGFRELRQLGAQPPEL